MTTKQINDAAKEHAKEVLGPVEFIMNTAAAKSIADDFKAGVKWAKENIAKASAQTK